MSINKREFKLIVIRPEMVVIFVSSQEENPAFTRQGPEWRQGTIYEMDEAAEWLRVNTYEAHLKIAIMEDGLEFGEELRGEMK